MASTPRGVLPGPVCTTASGLQAIGLYRGGLDSCEPVISSGIIARTSVWMAHMYQTSLPSHQQLLRESNPLCLSSIHLNTGSSSPEIRHSILTHDVTRSSSSRPSSERACSEAADTSQPCTTIESHYIRSISYWPRSHGRIIESEEGPPSLNNLLILPGPTRSASSG